MKPWILLGVTIMFALVGLKTLGVFEYWERNPRAFFSWIWGENVGDHLASNEEFKRRTIDHITFKIIIFWVGLTLLFANETFKAFSG